MVRQQEVLIEESDIAQRTKNIHGHLAFTVQEDYLCYCVLCLCIVYLSACICVSVCVLVIVLW